MFWSRINNNRQIGTAMIWQSICFALCFFSFMMAEAMTNSRAAELLGAEYVNTVYAIGLLCTGIGFLSFSVSRRLFKSERLRKAVICIVGIVCIVSCCVFLTTNHIGLFALFAGLALVSCGHIGGCVYYHHAMTFLGSPYIGRATGIGMSIAILLQILIHNLIVTKAVFIISIAISILLVLFIIFRLPKDWMLENPLPYSSENKTDKKTAGILIAAVALMSLVSGTMDAVITFFDAAGELNVYYGVRLFYALGLLAAGFLTDIQNKKYLPLATACIILLSSASTALLGSNAGAYTGIALMYLYSGFYVIFFTVMFCDFAPKTKHPELWAGMGRVVRCVFVSLTVMPVMQIYKAAGSAALVVISCALSIVLLLVLLPFIISALKKEPEIQAETPSHEELMQRFAKLYALTPRETEVLEKLLTTDEGVQEIADGLFISRRVLQRYISSVYEKTGTKSRIGLFQNYTRYIAENK